MILGTLVAIAAFAFHMMADDHGLYENLNFWFVVLTIGASMMLTAAMGVAGFAVTRNILLWVVNRFADKPMPHR